MSIFSPCLVLCDYEQAPARPRPVPAYGPGSRKRAEQFQVRVPNETRLKMLVLETPRRPVL